MKNISTILLVFVFLIYSCDQKKPGKSIKDPSGDNFKFDLGSPFKRFKLPDVLREISGISAVNDSLIACINDEIGVVYFYNLNRSQIDNKIKFTGKGDFEDLVIISDTVYILESTGTLWEIKNYKDQPQIRSYALSIEPPFELEGLSKRGGSLFVAAKYYHNKKKNPKGQLPVWQLTNDMQIIEPLFSLPDLIKTPGGLSIPFHTSALLYDELIDHWFCLSANEKAFIQCSNNGNLISIQELPNKIFSQPEGMCFTMSGDLLISNEGRNGYANILLFTNKNNLQ